MSHVQVFSITTALLGSGSIATLTIFDVPELQSQPDSRSLSSIRWLFSIGSRIFPSTSLLSAIGFIYCASTSNSQSPLWFLANNTSKSNTFLAAAALVFSIAPFTKIMIPTNFALIEMNKILGGSRSEKASQHQGDSLSDRSAWESVKGTGEGFEFTDRSGPQQRTERESTTEEDEIVRQLLERSRWLNLVRAMFVGAGEVIGPNAALT
ncbi:hypothetical protein F53441_10496 [Fusarium austroafricanum]|uniref:Uncharacterized protein n=1 Tax=Fusarium austroafricanum TaxID=2364996 RepID=A0A8H4K8V8_9HYPO|nr:hypothetical protein F53441_10496 [Fusarium austroafricanum]